MSMGSEYISDCEYERDQAIERWEKLSIKAAMHASHGIWHTKDGRTLNIEEMGTNHIKNCIMMLERNNSPFSEVYVPVFEKELKKRSHDEW